MENPIPSTSDKERVTWFSMWFLASIASFGLAFFPMFFRIVDSRNKHIQREEELERRLIEHLTQQGKEAHEQLSYLKRRNAKAWAASIIFVLPAFVLMYLLSKDLIIHEKNQDDFLTAVLPNRLFMPQTIPIKKYALITIITLGVGGIYWLYKIVNNYNAHYKAQWKIEENIQRLIEEKKNGESM
jgi:hypothetical protein